jgi:hypothetical protein
MVTAAVKMGTLVLGLWLLVFGLVVIRSKTEGQKPKTKPYSSFANTSRKNSTARGSPESPNDRIACFRTS